MQPRLFLKTIPIITSLILFSACSGMGAGETPTPGVQAGIFLEENSVSASGEVVPQKWASLSFPSAGQDLDILVEPGEVIPMNALLATVDNLAATAARDAANAQLESANAQLESANAQLASAKATLNRLELALYAQPDIDSGKAAVSAGEAAIIAAQAGIRAAETNLSLAEQALQNTRLYSPFSGTIVEVYGNDGEMASPGQPVILLADFSSLQVETTEMSEVDAMRINPGDIAEVSFDALPNENVSGKVLGIAMKKSAGSGVYYTVTVALDTIPKGLRWGMSAFVVINVK